MQGERRGVFWMCSINGCYSRYLELAKKLSSRKLLSRNQPGMTSLARFRTHSVDTEVSQVHGLPITNPHTPFFLTVKHACVSAIMLAIHVVDHGLLWFLTEIFFFVTGVMLHSFGYRCQRWAFLLSNCSADILAQSECNCGDGN
jgi:hypothetical protein